jgi:F-type H+-transporting ATPase subunit a
LGAQMLVAEGGEFVPPGVKDFFPPAIVGGITKPMVLVVLSVIIIATFFLLATRRLKLVPGRVQFAAEFIYDVARNSIARDQIGSKDFKRFVPLIFAIFTFMLVNNIYGLIPVFQFPSMAHIGYAFAIAIFIVYPVFNYAGIRRHGLGRYLKNQVMPSGPPWPIYFLLTPVEIFVKFFMNPLNLAIRIFAAMFAGHLIIMLFSMASEYLLLEADGPLKPVALISFLFAIAMTFLEALVMVLQAYIFALLTANYIGMALADEH